MIMALIMICMKSMIIVIVMMPIMAYGVVIVIIVVEGRLGTFLCLLLAFVFCLRFGVTVRLIITAWLMNDGSWMMKEGSLTMDDGCWMINSAR